MVMKRDEDTHLLIELKDSTESGEQEKQKKQWKKTVTQCEQNEGMKNT